MAPFLFLAAIVVVPVVLVLIQYNGLVGLRNHIREAWSNIDTELKRRHDLIPNLVEVVKGYAAHERTVLERVIELRNRCQQHHESVDSRSSDETQLTDALGQLMMVAENYPTLKADQHYMKLQQELVNTEDRIQSSRRFYNGNVREYRNKCQMFPSSIVASLFGFRPESYFGIDASERRSPSVRL